MSSALSNASAVQSPPELRCGRTHLANFLLAAAWLLVLPLAVSADNNLTGAPVSKDGGWAPPIDDQRWYGFLLLDPFEYQLRDGDDSFGWEADGWFGGDYDRLWVKTEGDLGEDAGQAESQLLYGRLIAPFWDLQLGLRYDQPWGSDADPSRLFLVFGAEGLAPYFFDVEPAIFFSDGADVSARLEATMDILFTQQLILQPRLELEAAAQPVEENAVGQGLNEFELGARLRYEVRREFAPYVGISWTRKTGETAGVARRTGGEDSDFSVVLGVRTWY